MRQAATILVIMLAAVAAVRAQEEWPSPTPEPYAWPTPYVADTNDDGPECDHESSSAERFEAVRLLPPVKIRNFDLRNIEYTFEDKHGIHVGALSADSKTVMPKDIWKTYKQKQWWLLYCARCKHIYTIVEVLPSQIKEKKK